MTVLSMRLGDEVDDYCPRCKLLLNHAVAGMLGPTVVKVVCQTCHSEHPFKNGEVPPKKKAAPRLALMNQVLAKSGAPPLEAAVEEIPPPSEEEAEPKKKKSSAAPARYITRHSTRPPRGSF